MTLWPGHVRSSLAWWHVLTCAKDLIIILTLKSLTRYDSNYFSPATATAASRAKFIRSIVQFLQMYTLDGVDFDWCVSCLGKWCSFFVGNFSLSNLNTTWQNVLTIGDEHSSWPLCVILWLPHVMNAGSPPGWSTEVNPPPAWPPMAGARMMSWTVLGRLANTQVGDASRGDQRLFITTSRCIIGGS